MWSINRKFVVILITIELLIFGLFIPRKPALAQPEVYNITIYTDCDEPIDSQE